MRAGALLAAALAALAGSGMSVVVGGDGPGARTAGATSHTLVVGDPATRAPTPSGEVQRSVGDLFDRLDFRRGRPYGHRDPRYPKHAGWTDARYRRAAAKKRNQARNRRAHRA